jgi:hypothetical protein
MTIYARDCEAAVVKPGRLVFSVGGREALRFEADGTVLVQGRLAANDQEVYELARQAVLRRSVAADGAPVLEVLDVESELEHLKAQIDVLAKVILAECPEEIDERRGDVGACAIAARLLTGWRLMTKRLEEIHAVVCPEKHRQSKPVVYFENADGIWAQYPDGSRAWLRGRTSGDATPIGNVKTGGQRMVWLPDGQCIPLSPEPVKP